MKNKIIISLLALILISFTYLGWTAKKQQEAQFWSVYFENPQSSDLGFLIENHAEDKEFQWKIMRDKEEIDHGRVVILKNEIKKATPEIDDLLDTKISIIISTDEEEKEIYKNF